MSKQLSAVRSDSRYDFLRFTGVKAIVENSLGKILLLKEPESNAWMPGRWGLPGGKPLEKESLYDAFKRKTKDEVGKELAPEGIYRIDELLIKGATVMFFHLLVKVKDETSLRFGVEHKWIDEGELSDMKLEEFTEYFNKTMLISYLKGDKRVLPLDVVKSWDYYRRIDSDPKYKRWMGRNNPYVK